jgi:hypothetical protein
VAGPKPLDPRIALFRPQIETSLKPKDPKAFDKMFDVESCKNAFMDFLNEAFGRLVVSVGEKVRMLFFHVRILGQGVCLLIVLIHAGHT